MPMELALYDDQQEAAQSITLAAMVQTFRDNNVQLSSPLAKKVLLAGSACRQDENSEWIATAPITYEEHSQLEQQDPKSGRKVPSAAPRGRQGAGARLLDRFAADLAAPVESRDNARLIDLFAKDLPARPAAASRSTGKSLIDLCADDLAESAR